jgi:hypothetical protein
MVAANSRLKAVLQQRDAELAAQRELLQQQGELLQQNSHQLACSEEMMEVRLAAMLARANLPCALACVLPRSLPLRDLADVCQGPGWVSESAAGA